MRINYGNDRVQEYCTSLTTAKRHFDAITAKKILERINFFQAAENLQSLINFPPLHFHALKGSRDGTYAMDVNGRRSSHRFICHFNESKVDVFSNATSITIIEIEEVSNHYE